MYCTSSVCMNSCITQTHLLYFLVQNLLHELAEVLKLGLVFLHLFLLVFILGQLQSLLSDGHQRLSVEVLQLLDTVLVDGLGHVQHLETSLAHALHKSRVGDLVLALAWGRQTTAIRTYCIWILSNRI